MELITPVVQELGLVLDEAMGTRLWARSVLRVLHWWLAVNERGYMAELQHVRHRRELRRLDASPRRCRAAPPRPR